MTVERPRGLHGQVVHMLGARILAGDFPPGAILDLPALENELGISHTVLRESLKVLTAITMLPRLHPQARITASPLAASVVPNIIGVIPGHRYRVADEWLDVRSNSHRSASLTGSFIS